MLDILKEKVAALKEKATAFSILYVEDEEALREKVAAFLKKIFTNVETAVDGREGFEKYLCRPYDIVITDILMPNMNGLELIQKIREHNEEQEIIVISAYTDSEYLTQCIQLEVTGYMIKPIDFSHFVKTLDRSIDQLTAFRENEMYKTKLETMVEERTQKVLHLQKQMVSNYEQAIHSLVKMIEGRDTYTGGHSERVAAYSRDIAKAMGFNAKECDLIYQAGILHDIGKIITPDAILLKPGRLTEQEYGLIKEHVTAGYEILSGVPMYHELAGIVYAHHEHYDGSGYPQSIKGEAIPLFGRIMAVADAFDAMTTSRIYKSRKTVSEAVEELKTLSGSWYDPRVVASAVDVLRSVTIDASASQLPNSTIDDERLAYFYKDSLTHLYNHEYLDFVLQKSRAEQSPLCVQMLYLKNFTTYNQQHGWTEGDRLLREFSALLQAEFPDFQIFRIFGDDFVLLHGTHNAIDIEKINRSPLLQKNRLYCEYRHMDLKKTNIESYLDLHQEV